MPFCEINQAQIYYQTIGRKSDEPPILLIHGSTVTGAADWGHIAPLLGKDWLVVVPDCRGHGKSSNPNFSYRFSEMADDFAGLIGKLGLGAVHVIGHSNGGNVALCLLLEYPNLVARCVLQAANAYVSRDLVEKEPPLFEPDRVAERSHGWMQEMIELHSGVHGKSYWRDLLQMTVQEIIQAPNYTKAELARVEKPVLVIQGEKDTVNNVGKHAQFIAKHIPGALLWIPESVDHNVHHTIPIEWLNKVNTFLRT